MTPTKLKQFLEENYAGNIDALRAELDSLDQNPEPLANINRPDLTNAPDIISIKNLSKLYKLGRNNNVAALTDVTLTVKQGEFVAITGASGSGKSTLLQIIGGIDVPSGGSIVVDGQNIAKLSQGKLATYRQKTVGFVFQFFYLQPFLNLARNIEVPMMFAKSPRKQRKEAIAHVAEAVGLSDRVKHMPKQLSGGQIQRVAIARALVNKPKVLLADEPTGNLDSVSGKMIVDLLHTIREQEGTTVIVVTHDSDVAQTADRIINLKDGLVV